MDRMDFLKNLKDFKNIPEDLFKSQLHLLFKSTHGDITADYENLSDFKKGFIAGVIVMQVKKNLKM
jgi:hypothetical protein